VANLLKRLPLAWSVGLTLFAGRGRSRVSVATVVSVLGIGVGVATLTAVLSVTGGFEEAFRDRILGVYPHMVVLKRGERFSDYQEVTKRLSSIQGVIGANPSTYDEMMASSDYSSAGVIVKGVDLDGIDRVSNLRSLTKKKSLQAIRMKGDGPTGVVIGCGLMERLQIGPGDSLTLTTPIRGIEGRTAGPLGMAPMEGAFVVRDCFDSGFYEYDSRLVVMDLQAAQAFLNRGPAVRWIEVRLEDMFDTASIRREIMSVLQPYTMFDMVTDAARLRKDFRVVFDGALPDGRPPTVRDMAEGVGAVHKALRYSELGAGPPARYRIIDWKQMNRNLFSALRMQKVVLAMFFLIIVVVAAFNIVGTQLVVARERLKEISTLVALGAARRQLYRIFVAHGFVLGSAGVLVGLVMGCGVVNVIRGLDFALDPKVYHITELPAAIHGQDIAVIGAVSVVVVLISCLLSSLRAIRINPVDGLRKIA